MNNRFGIVLLFVAALFLCLASVAFAAYFTARLPEFERGAAQPRA